VYERSDEELNKLYDLGRKVSLAYFETIYKLVGTEFDAYFFESEAGPKGKQLVLDHPAIFVDSEGAKVFKGEEHGLHTRVFLNKEGLPTYEAKELALAKMKEDRLGTYDHSVVSTAAEINEYFKVLKKAMSFIYPELEQKTEHIGHGMVRLASGKMSSRTGDVIAAKDFIAEVADAAAEKLTEPNEQLATDIAIAAIKYVTLKGDIRQDTVFDKEKALSFEGDSGPYLQYTHARICSVLTKAASAGVGAAFDHPPAQPYGIERRVSQFEAIVREALAERAPHKVTHYLTELAGEFNAFYTHEKIADAGDEYAPYKAAVAKAVRQTLKNGLWVLGIKAPERM
jgi:arginyl-tRNA synthetase